MVRPMSILSDCPELLAKTRELCEAIASDAHFLSMQEDVEKFLNDDAARLQYQSVHERGEELHHKQHAGVELSAVEIREFEAAREALFENEVATDFMAAQKRLEQLQKEIRTYVSLTLELGHVPSDEDLAQAGGGGCCGGGGCGC